MSDCTAPPCPRVAILGQRDGPHVAALRHRIEGLGEKSIVLDPDTVFRLEPMTASLSRDGAWSVRLDGADLRDVRVFLDRRRTRAQVRSSVVAELRNFAVESAETCLQHLLAMAGARVVNGSRPHHGTDNKVYQLHAGREAGFLIPETIVTTNPDHARTFIEERGQAAVKSLNVRDRLPHNQALYTNLVTPAQLDAVDDVALAPTTLQEYVDKEAELRVMVIGDDVLGVRIDSQRIEQTKVDWRRYPSGFASMYASIDVDGELASKSRHLTKKLGLDYAGIDIIQDRHGSYWFLEANNRMSWLWLEEATGVPVTQTLAEYLVARASHG